MSVLRNNLFVILSALLVTAVIIVAGLLILNGMNKDKHDLVVRQAEAKASLWRSTLESHILRTVTTADSVAGFIFGGAKTIPKHNGTVKERQAELINPDSFPNFAKALYDGNPGLFSLQIQPSAVVNQVYPPGTAPIGLDLFQTDSQKIDVFNAIKKGGTVVAGPLKLVQGGMGLIARSPVFIGSSKTFDTWWGNGVAVVMLDRFVNGTGINALVDEGYNYHLEYINQNTLQLQPIANSTLDFDKQRAVNVTVRLPNGFQWNFFVSPIQEWDFPLRWYDILMIVGIAVAGGLLVLCLSMLIRWLMQRSQRNVSAAPTSPPLALIFTDIESSTDLWASCPAAMAQALLLHNRIIRHHIKATKSYEVKTVGDSFMIACKSPKMALDLCMAAQKGLRAEKGWPTDVEHFYGTGIHYLKVRMGVHYCHAIDCVFDEISKGYDYYGNDVNKCARIESAASGGEVFMSSEMAQEASDLGAYKVESVGEHALKGIREPQLLYRLVLGGEPERFCSSPSPTQRKLSIGMKSSCPSHNDTDRTLVDRVVQDYLDVTAEELNGEELLQRVETNNEVLQLIFSTLPAAMQRDVQQRLCKALGVDTVSSLSIPRLALRISQMVAIPKLRSFTPRHGMYLHPSPKNARLGKNGYSPRQANLMQVSPRSVQSDGAKHDVLSISCVSEQ